MDYSLVDLKKAENWLKMAEGKWRLQTMQHRGRYNPKTGEYRELPVRVRRFLNGTPVSCITLVLDLLKKQAPYRSGLFNWEHGDDLEYRPTNTFIRKDGAELAANTDATYTIVQDLLLVTDNGDTLDMLDESSCSRIVKATYYWDETDVMDCPVGTQGVSYQVSGVSKDRETDLFSYSIREVTALTQHLPETTVSCNSKTRVTVETWDNVYGSKGDYRYDNETGGGAAITVPEPCDATSAGPGCTEVAVSVSENADCTFKIEVRRTYAVTDVDGYWSYSADRFKWSDTVRTFNSTFRFENMVDYSNGLTTEVTSEMNDDGTFTNTVKREQEREVTESSWEKTVTPRGVRVTYVDTNVSGPSKSLPPGTSFGSVKTTKTPGGLYVNEYTSYSRTYNERLGAECEQTAYRHTHGYVTSAASVSTGDVKAAGGGRVYSRTFTTDSEGFVSQNERWVQEITEKSATRAREVLATGVRTTYRHRSDPTLPSLTFKTVGRSVSATLTDGKWWDWEETEFTPAADVKLGLECETSIFSHGHTDSKTVKSVGKDAEKAGDGKTYRLSYNVNEQTGAVTERSSVTTELPVEKSVEEIRVTARTKTTTVKDSNQKSPGAAPTGAGESVTNEKTPGGLYNVTTVKTEPLDVGPIGQECKDDQYSHSHSETKVTKTAPTGDVPAASGGKVSTRSGTLGDDGLWQVREGYTLEHGVQDSRVEYRVTARGMFTTRTNTSVGNAASAPSNSPGNVGKTVVSEKTPGRLYTNTVTEFARRAGSTDIGETCDRTVFEHVHTLTRTQGRPASEVYSASGGHIYGRSARLDEQTGSWDVTNKDTWELFNLTNGTTEYHDAFGSTTEDTHRATSNSDAGTAGAKIERQGTANAKIRHMKRQRTPGGLLNVQVTEETPLQWDSGWISIDRPSGNATVHLYEIVFRNKTDAQVKSYIDVIRGKNYNDGAGTYSVSPSVNVSPNKFGLLDGTISLTTRFTPAGFAVGCRKKADDPPFEVETTYVDVQYQPLEKPKKDGDSFKGKMLAIIREETHLIGSGVGFAGFRQKFDQVKRIKGSQFHFNPAGENYTYDIITKCTTKFDIVDEGSHAYPEN